MVASIELTVKMSVQSMPPMTPAAARRENGTPPRAIVERRSEAAVLAVDKVVKRRRSMTPLVEVKIGIERRKPIRYAMRLETREKMKAVELSERWCASAERPERLRELRSFFSFSCRDENACSRAEREEAAKIRGPKTIRPASSSPSLQFGTEGI